MGRKKGTKNKPKEEIKPAADGAGIGEAATTQDEPVQAEYVQNEPVVQPESVVTTTDSPEANEPAQSAVDSVVSDVAMAAVKASKENPSAKGIIAKFDTCRYHEEFEPRVFKEGSMIPEDWHENQRPLKRWWIVDASGNWTRADKE